MLNWDDTGSLLVATPEEDRDFDDFLVRAGGNLACVYDQVSRAETNNLVAANPHGVCEAPQS